MDINMYTSCAVVKIDNILFKLNMNVATTKFRSLVMFLQNKTYN